MKPLYWIASGLAIVVLTSAREGWYDVSEVIGTGFVLIGWIQLARARPDFPSRLALWYLAVLTFAFAILLGAPAAREWLDDADPAVVWASSLPALTFQAVLCHALGTEAKAAEARLFWLWHLAEAAILFALVASVLYDGADWEWLYGSGTVGLAGVLLVVVLGIVHGPEPWAGGISPAAEEPAEAD